MKKKILHVVTALSWRGGEQQAAYLIDELKNEVDNVVLCSANSKMAEHCKKQSIRYFEQAKKSGLDISYAKKLKSVCEAESINLIHLHDAHAHTFAILAATFLGNKTPLVLSRRVDFPIKPNLFSKFKYNHSAIKRILCVSDTIKNITAKGVKDKSKLSTVYSGIDLSKFQASTNRIRKEFNISANQFLIGNTSALADHKDYFTFIEVAERIIEKHENAHFIIMGDGPMKEEIQDFANSKKLNKKLIFTGFRTDIPEVLAELDLFLITSKTEGLGTSILDAFACEVPVVATAGGGIVELVEHEKTGLLCEVKNLNQIEVAVEAMIQDDDLRKTCIEGAKAKVQLFSKQNTAKETLKNYLAILR